jgi:hypothetical protein
MNKINVLAMVLAATSVPAAAQDLTFMNGNTLYEWCTSTNAAGCLGFVEGVVDTISMLQSTSATPRAICVPKGVTAGQTRDVIVAYLKDKPQMRHYNAASNAWVALHDVWPCP